MAGQTGHMGRHEEGRDMKLREWMSPDPVTVGPTTTVREARRLLRYYGVRHLPVVSKDGVVGMISDRDVRIEDADLSRIGGVNQVASVLGSSRLVEDVMSSPAYVIRIDETVEAAARLMLSRRISALPVVDADNMLVGVVTTTDCLLASLTPQPAAS
jgi:acetoin utilization protein AcuB